MLELKSVEVIVVFGNGSSVSLFFNLRKFWNFNFYVK